jgi:hypothetical protein
LTIYLGENLRVTQAIVFLSKVDSKVWKDKSSLDWRQHGILGFQNYILKSQKHTLLFSTGSDSLWGSVSTVGNVKPVNACIIESLVEATCLSELPQRLAFLCF